MGRINSFTDPFPKERPIGMNFFRRKPRFDDAAKQVLVESLAAMLELQKAVAVNQQIEDASGRINRKALGYIYGFLDSALSSLGQDMSDVAVGVPITCHVLRHLFPGREKVYAEFLAAHMGNDEAVTLGAMKGGQQYIDFVVK